MTSEEIKQDFEERLKTLGIARFSSYDKGKIEELCRFCFNKGKENTKQKVLEEIELIPSRREFFDKLKNRDDIDVYEAFDTGQEELRKILKEAINKL